MVSATFVFLLRYEEEVAVGVGLGVGDVAVELDGVADWAASPGVHGKFLVMHLEREADVGITWNLELLCEFA